MYDAAQVAAYLTAGYWGLPQGSGLAFNTGAGDSLTFNVSGLTADGKTLARAAFEAWGMVTGITFSEVTGSAKITLDDAQAGAFANFSYSGNTLLSATVNISAQWLANYGATVGSYGFQTYLHEIGHALGLGHAGGYDGNADWAADGTGSNHYLNDSWQMSVMSYFSQTENAAVDASHAYVIAPQIADIVAIQALYGTTVVQGADTVWGQNGTTGTYLDAALAVGGSFAFALRDDGGTDRLNASAGTGSQVIDLRSGQFSSLWGETANVLIAPGSVIEEAVGGSGADTIRGNADKNQVWAGNGGDTVFGGGLKDVIYGEAGNDTLWGEHGLDVLDGGEGDDVLKGGVGNDVLRGGDGNDVVQGGSGADLGLGGAGNDVMFGDFGDDTLNGYGGADTLRGGSGADVLSGGDGMDRLVGGQGADTLSGGEDADVFVFESSSGADVIQDFEVGVDRIGLAGVAAITSFADLVADHLAEGDNGAVISWAGGSVILAGVLVAALDASDFLF